MKKLLSASEMKQVRGGAEESSYCYPGEKLYTCTTTYEGGAQSTGVACAKSGTAAEKSVLTAHTGQLDGALKVEGTTCS